MKISIFLRWHMWQWIPTWRRCFSFERVHYGPLEIRRYECEHDLQGPVKNGDAQRCVKCKRWVSGFSELLKELAKEKKA